MALLASGSFVARTGGARGALRRRRARRRRHGRASDDNDEADVVVAIAIAAGIGRRDVVNEVEGAGAGPRERTEAAPARGAVEAPRAADIVGGADAAVRVRMRVELSVD